MNDLDLLRVGGVVGGGGAGFPLWKKLSSGADTLLINGAECEPLLRSDQYLMLTHARKLVCAAERMRVMIGAQRAIICLKDHYRSQRAALEAAIKETGLCVLLHDLPTVYPIGDEQAVVLSATGRVVPPGGLPGKVGCTVVSVSTAVNAWRALEGKPVNDRIVTVAGEVGRPGLYRAPIGVAISEVLRAAGGTTRECRIMLGGPMMGVLQPEIYDAVVTKTCGGIIALPKEHALMLKSELPIEHMRRRARSVCIQCRTCTDLCPRFLSGHPIYPHLSMRAFAMGHALERSAALCMECGVCEMYACPMGLNPRAVQRSMKAALRENGEKCDFDLIKPNPFADGRHVPSERLSARIRVSEYEFDTPTDVTDVEVSSVRIPLKQHIGAPATACVKVGDDVRTGQTVGRMSENALGADVHASIDGRVTSVTAQDVTVEGRFGA